MKPRVFLLLIILIWFPQITFSRNKITVKPIYSDFNYEKWNFVETSQWKYWVDYRGPLANDPLNGGAGGGYFSGKKIPLVYLDGLIWGAFLRDSAMKIISDTPRVGGIYYLTGTSPGRIISENGHLTTDVTFERIFKIKKNWQMLTKEDFKKEWRQFGREDNEITDYMIDELRAWYADNWKNWPVEAGAPFNDVNGNDIYDPVVDEQGYPIVGKGDYPGIAEADQVLWFVVNDLNKYNVYDFSGSPPIGLELQTTLWTYQTNFIPFDNTVFKRYVLINKSNYFLDSMYVSQFVDADVGDYADDLVGCDSSLSLGFAYTAYRKDRDFAKFKLIPSCVGFGLLLGPAIQTNNSLDTAIVDFSEKIGYKNLPMTSFNYFAPGGYLGGEPPFGSINLTLILYNMMRGFAGTNNIQEPVPLKIGSGPKQGQITKFPLSGDPVNDPQGQWGDVDGRGWNFAPGDRRLMVNSGPFTMRPGESKEIIYAVIGGYGKDHRQGITQIKGINKFLRKIVRNKFKNMNPAPPAPLVKASPFDDYVVLNWGWDEKSVREIENKVRAGYRFEGYNVYQLPDNSASIDDPGAVKLATFDVVNGVFTIEGLRYFPEKGRYIRFPLQEGDDTGIQHYFIARGDSVHQRPFYRGSTYYFAVTAYNYNPSENDQPSIESGYQVIKVTIQDEKPGYRYQTDTEQAIEVNASKESDMQCEVKVIDPAEVTGHDYKVYFTYDLDTTSQTYGQWLWNLKDETLNKVVLKNQIIKLVEKSYGSPNVNDDQLLADGLLVKVWQPKPTLKAIVEVANARYPEGFPDEEMDHIGAPYGGNSVWHSLSAWSDGDHRFYVSAGGDAGALDRLTLNIDNAKVHDFELRFGSTDGYYVWWDDDSNKVAVQVPFEAWDVGIETYDDFSDDLRCLTGGFSGNGVPGSFGFKNTDPVFGFPATDWIDIRRPLNEKGSYQAFVQDITSGTFNYEWWNNSQEVLSNIIICDFGGARSLPENGTVIRFITTKSADEDLTFSFTAPDKIENDPELMKKDVKKINVFPNPYYAASPLEPDRFTHFVTFNHLPPHAVIRIFTLGGALVRKLEKNDPSQFYRWDLLNEKGWRVASGLYIVHIDMPELKKQKILKLMVITGEEVLDTM